MDNSNKEISDRLSELPTDLRWRILSFLPARDAARTCLIKPFGDLWREIYNIDLDESPFHEVNKNEDELVVVYPDMRFIGFVRSFLMLRNRTIKIDTFRLRVLFTLDATAFVFGNQGHEIERENLEREMEMWLQFPLRRHVQVLDLGFGLDRWDELIWITYHLPTCVWCSNSIVELSLLNCQIKLPHQVQMGSLMVLRLEGVGVCGKSLRVIARSCNRLQRLTVINCYDLEEIQFSAPNLEKLTLRFEGDIANLTINCPNLKSFSFYGFLEPVQLINLSSVRFATLHFKDDFNVRGTDEQFLEVLGSILKRLQWAKIEVNEDAFMIAVDTFQGYQLTNSSSIHSS